MIYTVVVTEQAANDIDRNALWWSEHHSIDQAIEWKDTIYDQLDTLNEYPERCSTALENAAHPEELLQFLVGLGKQRSYRAIFTIRDDEVHVLTVRRASQDTWTF